MNFTFSEDLKMLRGLAKDFTNGEIKPIAQRIYEEEKIPNDLIKKLAEVGFFGTAFPEEFGGGGFGKVGYCIMMEDAVRSSVAGLQPSTPMHKFRCNRQFPESYRAGHVCTPWLA